jgi:hypothetical protein
VTGSDCCLERSPHCSVENKLDRSKTGATCFLL